MLQKYAIMLLSKIFLGHKNTFSHRTVSRDSTLSGSALVLLELSEASSPESSTSSPSLETVVNLVPEAIRQATSTTTGLVAFGHFFLSSHMETAHAQYARG